MGDLGQSLSLHRVAVMVELSIEESLQCTGRAEALHAEGPDAMPAITNFEKVSVGYVCKVSTWQSVIKELNDVCL